MVILWFVLASVFLFLEIGNPGLLYFLALFAGAIGASFVSWFGYSLEIQYIVFFVMSFIAIALVYIFVCCFSVPNKGFHRSNTDLLLGKAVTIIELQSPTVGQGKLGGEIWLIKLQGEGELRVGLKATVVGIQGCHLKVQIFIHD